MTPLARLLAIALLGGILIAGAFAVLKWESAPTEKLAAAQKAVNEARAAGAQALLSEEYAGLEAMLARAKAEIEEQNARLGFLRNYATANDLLDVVVAEAARLKTEAGKRQDEVKAAAVQAQRGAQEAVLLAQDLLEEAPGGKERAVLTAIKADVQKLNASLSEVNTSIDSGNYQAAETKANEIRSKADGIVAELRRAIEKAKAGAIQ